MTCQRMEDVRLRLETAAIGSLQFAKLLGLRLMRVDRKRFINEQVPDFRSLLARIERLVLSVTDAAEFFIGNWRLRAVRLTHELDDAFALIDLLAQHVAQIAAFGSKNILPDRLVTKESQRIRNQLPGAMKLASDC